MQNITSEIPSWQSLLVEIQFGNQINIVDRRNERNRIELYIFQFHTRDKRGNNIFVAPYVVSHAYQLLRDNFSSRAIFNAITR